MIGFFGEAVTGTPGAMEQLAPICLLGGVGEVGADRGPNFCPWDARAGGELLRPFRLARWPVVSHVELGEVHGDLVDGEVGEAAEVVAKSFVILWLAWRLSFHVPTLIEREGAGDGAEDGCNHFLLRVVVFVFLRVRLLILAVEVAPSGDGGNFISWPWVDLRPGEVVEPGGIKENLLDVTRLVN